MDEHWDNINISSSSAAKVLKMLDKMKGNKLDKVDDAYSDLYELMIKKGKWSSVSAPVIKSAFERMLSSVFPEFYIRLIADILAADCNDLWLGKRIGDSRENANFKDCLEIVSEQRDIIVNFLDSENSIERSEAVNILGATLGIGGWEQDILEKYFKKETSPIVRSSFILAFEQIDKSSHWSDELRRLAHNGYPDQLVWGIATICWLHRNPKHSAADVIRGMEAWLSSDYEDIRSLGLFSRQNNILANILKDRGDSERRNALTSLVELGKITKNNVVIGKIGEVFNCLMGFPDSVFQKVIPANELNSELRFIAEELVDTWVYPSCCWMPSAGARRRRWLGLDKPGIMESPVPDGIDSQKPPRPLWQVLVELNQFRKQEQLLPAGIANILDVKQQWRVAVEFYLWNYGNPKLVEDNVLTVCGLSVVGDEEILNDIYMFCRERLMKRKFSNSYSRGGGPVTSRLLFLPLLRSGRSIPEEFYCLAWLEDQPEEREIMASISRDFIAGIMLDDLIDVEPRSVSNTLMDYLPIIDVAPTPEVCDALVRAWVMMISDPSIEEEEYKKYDKMLRKKSKIVPELKKSLASHAKEIVSSVEEFEWNT
jgi:hypothetical protein